MWEPAPCLPTLPKLAEMSQLSEMTEAVVNWIRPLLSDDSRDPMNTSIKLSEEASELTHAIYTNDDVGQECADVLILLLDIAFLRGINLEDEFNKKMVENRDRIWNRENG